MIEKILQVRILYYLMKGLMYMFSKILLSTKKADIYKSVIYEGQAIGVKFVSLKLP